MLFNLFASFALTAMVTPIVSCSPVNGQVQARADAQAMTPAAAFAVLQTTANDITHIASDIQNSAAKGEFNAATTKQEISAAMTPLEQATKALQAGGPVDGVTGALDPVLKTVTGLLGCLTGLLGCGSDCKSQRKRDIIVSRAITAEEATTFVNTMNGNVARLRAEIDNVASAGEMTPEHQHEFWWRLFDDCYDLDAFLHRFHHFDRRDAPTNGGSAPANGAAAPAKGSAGGAGDLLGGLLGTVTGLFGGLLGSLGGK